MSEDIYKAARLGRLLRTPKMKAASAARQRAAAQAEDAASAARSKKQAFDQDFMSRMRQENAAHQARRSQVARQSRQPKPTTRVNAYDQLQVGTAGSPFRRATQADVVGGIGKAENVYKAARRQRDLADAQNLFAEDVEVEKFGALVRLGTSGLLKTKGGQKAMSVGRKAKKTWGGMSTGAKMGTAAGASAGAAGLGGGYLGSKLGD